MKAYEVVANKVEERGITTAELARRVGMHSVLLGRSLKGNRNLSADELVNLCVELNLKLSDFTKD